MAGLFVLLQVVFGTATLPELFTWEEAIKIVAELG